MLQEIDFITNSKPLMSTRRGDRRSLFLQPNEATIEILQPEATVVAARQRDKDLQDRRMQ